MEEKKYLKKKEKARADGVKSALAMAANNLGDFYNRQGKYKQALVEYEQEATLYSEIGKQVDMAKAHRMCGEMCMLLCEFPKALEHIEIYLRTVRRLQNKVEEQRAYATLGRAYLLQGQSAPDSVKASGPLKNAEKAFNRSLLICKELSGQITKLEQYDMQARLYLNIGVVKEHCEDFGEAINYIEKAIFISKNKEIFELLHLCYVSMSLLHQYKMNDSTQALRYCNLALDVAKRLPDKVKRICETLITKAEILIKDGDFSSAKQILTKAYKKKTPNENDRRTIEKTLRTVVKIWQALNELIYTSSDNFVELKKIFERLGDGSCQLQNYPKAIEYYTKMLECARLNSESGKDLVPIYVSLYQTYKDNKQYEMALEFLWKEFEICKAIPAEAFATLCSIGEMYELQKQPFWTIQDIYQKALEYAKKAGNARLEKIAFSRLKKNQTKFKMFTMAEQLEEDARLRGFDLDSVDEDSESEIASSEEHNTPELGADVCLENLTDSDSSDLDESGKVRSRRKRGNCLTIKRNNKGETLLHEACISGNLELVRRLINQGHVVNVRDHAGWLPLHEACNHGFRDIVELLLNKGAASAINDKGGTSCDGITPLYDACANGFLDVVQLLLDRGADATVKTDYGDTCMQALDKWKDSVTLNPEEYAHYTAVRKIISDKLSKAGISVSVVSLNQSLENRDLSIPALENVQQENDEDLWYTPRSFPRRSSTIQGQPNSLDSARYDSGSSAKQEYRNVIAQLKHPNRLQISKQGDEQSSSSVASQKKRPAFLESDDVDDYSWLDDDVGQESKRRKHPSSWENKSDSVLYPDDDEVSHRQYPASNLRLSGTSSTSLAYTSRNKKKRQCSLIDSGFCRFRSESPISSDATDFARSTEPDSTTQPSLTVVSPVKIVPADPIVMLTVSFRIKVEDEMLLVPVERKNLNELNMRWLAEEASRRYYNLIGLKPKLRLKTADGFAFEDNDSITVAVEENMIIGTVVDWKMQPLTQRYEEMCLQTRNKVKPDVTTVLERGQSSNSLNLSNFSLTPNLAEPVIKAIMHQADLRVLDLSNNIIQNEGCKQLAKSLPTLKHLKTLNLSGNCITSDGLKSLVSTALVLSELEELNLSQNPLGNKSMRSLDRLLKGCRSVQTLNLSSCGLTKFSAFDLNFNRLIDFDISFNSLTAKCFQKLLTKLNNNRLQNLNLSFCAEYDNICSTSLTWFFENGTNENFKRVELAGCHLSDSDVFHFVQSLTKATELEVLNLSENAMLSPLALQYILNELKPLRKLILTNCPKIVDVQKLAIYRKSKVLPSFMSLTLNAPHTDINRLCDIWGNQWGGKGKIKKVGSQFIFYVNENDLL